MKINRHDIKILVDLYKAIDGLNPYIFYQRYKLSPATVFSSTAKFKDYVKIEDDRLFLTDAGKNYIEKNRFVYSKDRFDRIPVEFKGPKLDVNEPYLPNVKKLSKEILILQHKDDGSETCT